MVIEEIEHRPPELVAPYYSLPRMEIEDTPVAYAFETDAQGQRQLEALLASPKDKFTIRTYSHEGVSGNATQQRKQRVSQHQQTPEKTANISRQKNVKPSVQTMQRNEHGQPVVAILDGLKNMWGVNKNKTDKKLASPSAGKSDIEKVNELIEFATEFVSHDVTDKTSQTVIDEMDKGVYEKKPKEPKLINGKMKGYNKGIGYKGTYGLCAKHVKIALWKAGYNPPNLAKTQISGEPLAKDMGPDLVKAGFTNITEQLPDARWAAPGDIIVYEYKGDASGAGHIDIRTYDGYVSDFLETYLPVRKLRVTGIYRKYYDPLPEKRMRAFLKALALQEANTIFEREGYQEAYRTLPGPPFTNKFDSFKTHPFAEKSAKNTASGAYGITVPFWIDYLKKLDLSEGADKFSPIVQDRLVIARLESRPAADIVQNKGVNALGLIRKNEIEQAIKLANSIWPSLPEGGQERVVDKVQGKKLTMDVFIESYNKFLKELE